MIASGSLAKLDVVLLKSQRELWDDTFFVTDSPGALAFELDRAHTFPCTVVLLVITNVAAVDPDIGPETLVVVDGTYGYIPSVLLLELAP